MNREMIVNSMSHPHVAAARRRLSHQRGSIQHLQIVAESLGGGESRVGSEHKSGLVCQSISGNRWKRPALFRGVFAAVVEIVEVRGTVEEVGRDESDHVGITARVVPYIKDDRIRVVQRSHCSSYRGSADRSIRKLIQFQIAD